MTFDPSFTADDFRNKAAKHDRAADKLVSGDEKDAHIAAASACRKAADAKDKAALASAKCIFLKAQWEMLLLPARAHHNCTTRSLGLV